MAFMLCIPLPFVVIGGYLLYLGINGLYQMARCKSWPKTKVTVISWVIKEDQERESYPLTIYYHYSVDGVTYEGDSTVTCESAGDAQRVLNQHTKNENISALYNPNNPQEAVLETMTFVPSFAAGVYVFMGGGFLTIGLPLLFITIFAMLMSSSQG